MRISIISAMSKNRVIGNNGKLPWSIPTDMKNFKTLTLGKPVIMGRKTWESLKKPLPGRLNIVVSRNPNYKVPEGVLVTTALSQAFEMAENAIRGTAVEECMVIGGEDVYRMALPFATRMYLSHVDIWTVGDAHFPIFDEAEWTALGGERYARTDNSFAYHFVTYERKGEKK